MRVCMDDMAALTDVWPQMRIQFAGDSPGAFARHKSTLVDLSARQKIARASPARIFLYAGIIQNGVRLAIRISG